MGGERNLSSIFFLFFLFAYEVLIDTLGYLHLNLCLKYANVFWLGRSKIASCTPYQKHFKKQQPLVWGGGWWGRGSLVCLPPLHLFLPLSAMSDPRPCIRGGDLPRLREMSALSPSPLPPSPGFCEWNQNDTFRFHQSHHSHQFHAYWGAMYSCRVQIRSR